MNRYFTFPQGIFIVTLILGILVFWQMNSRELILQAQSPEDQGVVALEVSQLTSANAALRQELADLSKQEYDLAATLVDKKTAEEGLKTQQDKADILTGVSAVTGPGVTLTIKDELTIPQLTDVLNSIKNIGAEALAVNGVRVTPRYSIWRASLKPPYIFMAIGSPAVLSSSITRRGGIIDQMEFSSSNLNYSLTESDSLSLLGTTLPSRQYAEPVKKSAN